MKLTHLDLFSGIGGFSLAFESEGFETIGFSEIDPYASAVLKKHWPTITNYGDINSVPVIRCTVITGGFPCQPFSCAGKRKGKADNRYLWPSMLSVIQRCRPTWVLGENVPGILGMGFDQMLVDLESSGYQSQTFVVPACAVDAPHRRDRVWVVAHSESAGTGGRSESPGLQGRFAAETRGEAVRQGNGETGTGGVDAVGEVVAHAGRERDAAWRDTGDLAGASRTPEGEAQQRERLRDSVGNGCSTLADAQGVGWEGQRTTRKQEPSAHAKERLSVRRRSHVAHRNLKFGDWWGEGVGWWQREPQEAYQIARERGWVEDELSEHQSRLGRVADGIPRKLDRLRCLGNAIVPQVAQVFARAIREAMITT